MEARADPELARPASPPRHEVRTLLDVRIPVSDGLELSANLWLPVPVADEPEKRFPAILEMIPYRKDDWRAASDRSRGEWFAARGYAFCRLDVRGTGSSPGIALDEYTARETQDGFEAVQWLAIQAWCSGTVGMWGMSYGAFTAAQVAKLRPPSLKAILLVMGTDDRYTTDIHYVGGCVTVSELSQYAVSMVGMNALPPWPRYRGAGWIEEWRDRLERTPVWLFEWLRRQHDGPYWRQGSLAPDYDAIDAAIFSIGGWMDEYVDAALRMQERCRAPRRTLVGNWVHAFPDDAYPGPNLDWLHESARFFDRWLKGDRNGLEEEPRVVLYRHEYAPPEPFPAAWPGEWLAFDAWPPPGATERTLHLAPGQVPLVGELREEPPEPAGIERLAHRATSGTAAPLSWGGGSPPNGLARDMRRDEAMLPTFTSAPLDLPLDVIGVAVAELAWESSTPIATAVVRLSDVAPDGIPTQVTAGILNLTHRESDSDPTPLEPGVVHHVRVPMRATAHRFLAGHRLRLSVASGYWPVIWPSPDVAEHGIHLGGPDGSHLVLPVVPAGTPRREVPPLKVSPAGLASYGDYREEPPVWRVVEDVLDGTVTVISREFGEQVLPDGRSTLLSGEELRMSASDADPAHARLENDVEYRLRVDDIDVHVEASGSLTSTATSFAMSVDLVVRLDGDLFFERTWAETIPRRLV
jgi:uncharacterized protein